MFAFRADQLEGNLPVKLRKKARVGLDEPDRPLFTTTEMHQILTRALSSQEDALRHQYDALLQERLQEHFEALREYNEANLTNRLERSTHDYFS